MNTIKFSSIYDLKKETNNVEIYSIKNININNKNYLYYSNAQMSIYVNKLCNGSCQFCMNKYEKRFCNAKNINDESYFKNLEKVLCTLESKNIPITITGGEPTISNRLVKIIKMINQKGYKTRTFSTNGTGLFGRYENKPILEHLLENGIINNINISRMVIDDNKNKKIMNINQTNDLIRRIFNFGKINGMDMRLSCILQKSGVKSLKDILEFNDFYDNYGIDTIMFRELIPLKDTPNFYKDNVIKISSIFEEIANNKEFKYLKTLNGMYYIVNVYRYKNKLVKCYQEKKDIDIKVDDNVIREFVFYPDGNLDSGWNKQNGIILKNGSENYNE